MNKCSGAICLAAFQLCRGYKTEQNKDFGENSKTRTIDLPVSSHHNTSLQVLFVGCAPRARCQPLGINSCVKSRGVLWEPDSLLRASRLAPMFTWYIILQLQKQVSFQLKAVKLLWFKSWDRRPGSLLFPPKGKLFGNLMERKSELTCCRQGWV